MLTPFQDPQTNWRNMRLLKFSSWIQTMKLTLKSFWDRKYQLTRCSFNENFLCDFIISWYDCQGFLQVLRWGQWRITVYILYVFQVINNVFFGFVHWYMTTTQYSSSSSQIAWNYFFVDTDNMMCSSTEDTETHSRYVKEFSSIIDQPILGINVWNICHDKQFLHYAYVLGRPGCTVYIFFLV